MGSMGESEKVVQPWLKYLSIGAGVAGAAGLVYLLVRIGEIFEKMEVRSHDESVKMMDTFDWSRSNFDLLTNEKKRSA